MRRLSSGVLGALVEYLMELGYSGRKMDTFL